ncbi:carbohydrate kinase family protein [Pseudoalteromonas xiamenensis]|uniref:Carbohydrate kinase n=1 Tax=Pseudoalteromonas xiamenensis TaxID=882626 RepID=A0A975HN35_9GAMM|nr:carbohydrate kinase [Pseudoalteromonas xiamenensis]QTH73617.1 carbohydrate kinase [Pseudoalteromonas xiamenensis]
MTTLTCFGELLIDMLPSENGTFSPIAGGAPANVAVGYRKLGGLSRFIGGLGDDAFGDMLRKTIATYQVNDEHLVKIEGSQTALAMVALDEAGERRFSFYRTNTADLRFPLAELKKVSWPKEGLFHFCSNTLSEIHSAYTTLAVLITARQNNQIISFDVNLRQNLWQELSILPERVEHCYHFVDILKFSHEELAFLAEQKCISEDHYIEWIFASFPVKIILISNAEKPLQVHMRSFYRELPVPNIQAVDTTGAGDAFVAGFLFYLSLVSTSVEKALGLVIEDKRFVKEATRFAIQCGAHTCLNKGACPSMPDLKVMEHHITPFEANASTL